MNKPSTFHSIGIKWCLMTLFILSMAGNAFAHTSGTVFRGLTANTTRKPTCINGVSGTTSMVTGTVNVSGFVSSGMSATRPGEFSLTPTRTDTYLADWLNPRSTLLVIGTAFTGWLYTALLPAYSQGALANDNPEIAYTSQSLLS